jgi:glutamate---cysteine ligase / carboxylate-amine ligase
VRDVRGAQVSARQLGVEEEFLLVEPATGHAQAVAGAVMRQAGGPADAERLEFELQDEQLEINTRPCASLSDLRREVLRSRSAAGAAADRAGAGLAALGTSPLAVRPSVHDDDRHRKMAEQFGVTAHEQLTCGCHVHAEIASPQEGVAVLDRIQRWLAPLLALSGNSPFWQGADSGYASFRYQAWGRWPCSGPTAWFGSAVAYAETVQAMIDSGTILDAGMVYFNARLSQHYPTIEVRIADVCLFPDDAILIAALVRALVETEARSWRDGSAGHPVRPEVLQLAAWRASRSGLSGSLVHPVTGRDAAAGEVIGVLLDHVRPALDDAGDLAVVTELLDEILARGNGAAFQRAAYRRAGRLADVVNDALARTRPALAGRPGPPGAAA